MSARQRHKNHSDQVEKGDVRNPMVIHSVEMHGGKKPLYLSLINAIEPKPVYRAVRESVQISGMPEGPTTLNRCQEWGAPRVPILQVTGGGDEDNTTLANLPEKRKEWSRDMLEKINTGACKRIVYWDHSGVISGDHGDPDPLLVPTQHNPPKRCRTDPASSSSIRRMDQGEYGGGPSGSVSGDHRDPAPLGTTPPPETDVLKAPDPVHVLVQRLEEPVLGREEPSDEQQQENTGLDEDPRLERNLAVDMDLDKNINHTSTTTTTLPACVVPPGTSGEDQGSGPRGGVSGDHRDPSLPGTPHVPTTTATSSVKGNGEGTAMTAALATEVMPSIPQTRPGAAVRAAPNPEPDTPARSNTEAAVDTETETMKTAQQQAGKPKPKPKERLKFGATDVRLKRRVHKDNKEKDIAIAIAAKKEDALVLVPDATASPVADNPESLENPREMEQGHKSHGRRGARTKDIGPPRNPGFTAGPRPPKGPPGNPNRGRGSRGPRAPGLLVMAQDRRSSQRMSLMRWMSQGQGLHPCDGPCDVGDGSHGVDGGPGRDGVEVRAQPPRDANGPDEADGSRRLDNEDTRATQGGEGAAEGKEKEKEEEEEE